MTIKVLRLTVKRRFRDAKSTEARTWKNSTASRASCGASPTEHELLTRTRAKQAIWRQRGRHGRGPISARRCNRSAIDPIAWFGPCSLHASLLTPLQRPLRPPRLSGARRDLHGARTSAFAAEVRRSAIRFACCDPLTRGLPPPSRGPCRAPTTKKPANAGFFVVQSLSD
jgi:hypothetical protein